MLWKVCLFSRQGRETRVRVTPICLFVAQICLLVTMQYVIFLELQWSYIFGWFFLAHFIHHLKAYSSVSLKNYCQSVHVGSSSYSSHDLPLPQKHSEMKCLLKGNSNWIEFQVCLEQNECSRCTETHSRTESCASPWGRAIALGRPPGKLARLKLRDPNNTPMNLKNTRPCSPFPLLRCESVRLGLSIAPFRWLIAEQIFLKQPPIIRCN